MGHLGFYLTVAAGVALILALVAFLPHPPKKD